MQELRWRGEEPFLISWSWVSWLSSTANLSLWSPLCEFLVMVCTAYWIIRYLYGCHLLRKLLMLGRTVHIGPKIVDCVAQTTSLLDPHSSISCKRGRELHSKLHGKSSRFLISIPRDHLCRLDFSLHTLPCAAHCPHRFGRAEAYLPLSESPQMARPNLYTQPNYHTMALLCHRRQAHPR